MFRAKTGIKIKSISFLSEKLCPPPLLEIKIMDIYRVKT